MVESTKRINRGLNIALGIALILTWAIVIVGGDSSGIPYFAGLLTITGSTPLASAAGWIGLGLAVASCFCRGRSTYASCIALAAFALILSLALFFRSSDTMPDGSTVVNITAIPFAVILLLSVFRLAWLSKPRRALAVGSADQAE